MRKKILNPTLGIILILLTLFVTVKSYIPDNFDVNIGDICPEDIFATGEIVDEVSTEKLRQQAKELVQPNYKIDSAKTAQSQSNAEKALSDLRDNKKISIEISPEDKVVVSALDDESFARLVSSVKKAIEIIMSEAVTEENIEEKAETAASELKKLGVGEGVSDVASAVVSGCITVNTTIDEESYEAAKKDAALKVEPVVYRKGAKIIGKGEVIEEKHYKMMAQLGFIKEKTPMNIISHIGRAVLSLLLLSLLFVYIFKKKKKFWYGDFGAFCFVLIVQMLVILLFVTEGDWPVYIAPLIIVPISLTLMFDSRTAIIANIVTCFIAAIVLDAGIDFIISAVVTGTAVSFILSKTVSRSKVVYSSLIAAALSGVTVILYSIGTNASLRPAAQNSLFSVGGIMIGCVISIGIIPAVETIFGILTQFRLAEYVNFDNALLKRMIMEAPGTYHHSLMVGNLAENAADAIGVNPLLCRAGAYFHDVGKLMSPQMFKENQYSENPHDFMSPTESANCILSHPLDGVKLAREAKLPPRLIDFIYQHHGTTATAYFYHKAKESDENVDINDFRYKCVKPQSKEVAIVMLADTVEAAMRSAPDFTSDEMENFIAELIKRKADDGQFDECDLSFKDLCTVRKSFVSTLKGYFHKRIAYPGQGGGKDKNDEAEN